MALGTILADPIREDDLTTARATRSASSSPPTSRAWSVSWPVTSRPSLVAPTEVIDEEATAAADRRRRGPRCRRSTVSVQVGQRIVDRGRADHRRAVRDARCPRPDAAASSRSGTVVGTALIAILVAGLLVGYLWRFEPEIWHRNRSVLLFFLALVVTRGRHADRGRPDPARLRRAHLGDRAAHRHPPAAGAAGAVMAAASGGPRRRHEPRRARPDGLRPRRRRRVAAGDRPRRAPERVRPRLLGAGRRPTSRS